MEHSKYRSRLMVIAFVLLIGLIGIFPPGRLLNSEIPWSRKHALKPGIDIKGGTSLLYEIKAPPSGATPNLSEKVAEALKRRVDPQGVRNLIWRPQGPTRLEIQMPLSDGADNAAALRKAYSQAQEELAQTNIRLSEVRAALQATDPQMRRQQLDVLAMGSAKRLELFQKLDQAMKDLAAAEQANDPVRKVDARDNIADIERQIESTNISVARVQSDLELLHEATVNAQKAKKYDVVEQKRKERDAKLAEFKAAAADMPRRQQSLDKFVAAFDEYAKVKGVVEDAEDLKRLLRGSGVLEFRILVTDPMVLQQMVQRLQTEGPTPRADDLVRWYEVDQPEEFGKQHQGNIVNYGDKWWTLVHITPDESMAHTEGARRWGLHRAFLDNDSQTGQNVVGFEFDAQGAVLFGELTGRNVGRPLAIVLDEKVISAPNIRTRIESRGQITGDYSKKELDYLISTLNAGSLPAQLADEPISERTVGPTLGADNLRAGFRSCIAGIVVVAAFMIGYYYFAGFVAVLAVMMNLVLILGVMAMLNATFTLPGIAALVLTIGMAVDANVLIYERLREEQLRGLSLRMALRNAYDRAFSAILDSNLTTILTSLVLYWFGSEEVKGFGLTLAIGISTSMFTALYVTRAIFDVAIEKYGIKRLGSLPLTFPNLDKALRPNVDWMGKAWMFYAFSAVLTVVGLTAYFAQGRNMYDIEFVSGTSVQLELKDRMEIGKVRDLVRQSQFAKALPSAQVVSVGNTDKDYEIVTPNQDSKAVREAVVAALGDRLNAEPEARFKLSSASLDEAEGKAVLPVTSDGITVSGFTAPSAAANIGNVAIVLENLEPALSPEQIRHRIERLRLEPGSNLPFRQITIDTPQRDEKTPANLAVVFIADPGIDYAKDAAAWRQKLAAPMWRLVSESITRPADLARVTSINAQVATDTMMDALVAFVLSVVGIAAYIWIRFGNLKFGSATVVALLHDVLITLGIIGLSMYVGEWAIGRALLVEPFRMNLTLVAAILTVMGYSVNDTIIVFDRIRENRGKFGHINRQIINDSINQTLSRTLLTGGTTLITLFVMYVWGGEGIHAFTFALLAGILVGTYSSIAIASPILLLGSQEKQAADRKAPIGQIQRTGQQPA